MGKLLGDRSISRSSSSRRMASKAREHFKLGADMVIGTPRAGLGVEWQGCRSASSILIQSPLAVHMVLADELPAAVAARQSGLRC